MQNISILDFLVQTAAATNANIVLVRAKPDGSAVHLTEMFPSLSNENYTDLLNDGASIIKFENAEDARFEYKTLVDNVANEKNRCGEITLITPAGIDEVHGFGGW